MIKRLEEYRNTFCEFGHELSYPIGWFANKYNMAHGWTISELDRYTEEWLQANHINTSNVYRICSEHGLSIARFNFETGMVWFFDNNEYERTDRPCFLSPMQYNRIVLSTQFI